MSEEHLVTILVVLIPTLFGSGGFLYYLMDRVGKKQKEQIEESQKAFDVMEKVEKKIEIMDEDMKKIGSEVSEHTQSIIDIQNNQENMMGKLETLSDESREAMRQILLEMYQLFQRQGYVSSEQKALWIKRYKIYRELGGNGEIELLNQEVEKMPVRTSIRSRFGKKR